MACFAFFAQSTALQMVNSVDLPVRHLGRHRSRLPASGLPLSCHGIFCTEVQDRNFRVSAFGSTIRDPIPTHPGPTRLRISKAGASGPPFKAPSSPPG